MRRLLAAAGVAGMLAVGCGQAEPSDVALLRQACTRPPSSSSGYDYAYATVGSSGQITGVAACSTDGSVASWQPRPAGSGDRVVVYDVGLSD